MADVRECYENCGAEPRETIKSKLENMDVIMRETQNVLCMIEDAICGPRVNDGEEVDNQPESMEMMTNRLRNNANEILKRAVRIKEALW